MIVNPTDIIRSLYEKLSVGDAAGALGLMAPDGIVTVIGSGGRPDPGQR